MRAVRGEAALEVRLRGARPSSARELVGVGGRRARPVAQLGLARAGRAARRARANGRRRPSTASARSSISCEPVARQLGVPGVERRRARRAGAHPRDAARCAGRARASTRARVSARAGQSAATSWSRCARRAAGAPLTSSSRSGRKTLTSGRASRPAEAVDRAAVDAHALRPRPARSRPRAVLAVLADAARAPRAPRVAAAAHQLALVRGARRAGRAAEVERLEQVRLAGAVGPADHRQPVAELDLRPLVVAEVAQLDARDAHGAPTRSGGSASRGSGSRPSSPDWIRPGPQRADQLEDELVGLGALEARRGRTPG